MHESTFEFNLGKHRKGYMDCEGCEKIRSKSARLDAVVVSRSRSDQLRKRPLAPNMNESKHVKVTRDVSIYAVHITFFSIPGPKRANLET